MRIKILMLGQEEHCRALQARLRDEELLIVGIVSGEQNLLDEISRTSPDLILITDTSPASLRSCQQIYLLRPRSIPVVTADVSLPGTIEQVLQTGVHYILRADMENAVLIGQLKGIYANEANRILALENTTVSTHKSKVILVFGVKGGIGKSTLAANLAVRLAQKKCKVAVLDYDFQFGDINVFLGIDPRNTILELLQEQSSPNADTIRQFLSLHSSGVNLLPAPNSPEYGDSITAMQADRIVGALRVCYDYLIIDVPPAFNETTLACIDSASMILFVTGTDISALRSAKKALALVEALAGEEKIRLIVGRDSAVQIKTADVARVLGRPVWQSIPEEPKAAVPALNQGSPVVLEAPKSEIARAISRIADQIEEDPVAREEKKKKHLFGKHKK